MGRSYKALTVSNRGRMSAQLAILLMTSNPRLMYMHYNSSRKFTGRYGGNEYEIKVLDDKYCEISNNIQKEIEEREKTGNVWTSATGI